MQEIQGLIKFAELMNKFREIERTILIRNSDRRENDIEHSYQLAMCSWYIISVNKLNLDLDLALRYSLIHDLVEVYAGDTFIYDKDKSVLDSKVAREHAALEQLKIEFTEFPELTDLIETYEKRLDEESRFVYALDKVIAPLNIFLDGGRVWREFEITLDQHHENKKDKVKEHSEVEKYYSQLYLLFKEKQDSLFHQDEKI